MTRGPGRSGAVGGWNRLIALLGRIDPVHALQFAAAAGSVTGWLNLAGPDRRDVDALAPILEIDSKRLFVRMARAERRARAFEIISMQMTGENIARLVDWTDGSRERLRKMAGQPAILVFWHFGPANAIPFALSAAGIEALVLTQEEWPSPPPGIEVVETGEGLKGASSFRRSLERLRSGGIVTIAADAHLGAPARPVPCLGRLVEFRRGPGALARITGAQILPIVTTWVGGRRPISLTVREPLTVMEPGGDDVETEWTAEIASALEREVERRPELLRPGKLAAIMASPAVS